MVEVKRLFSEAKLTAQRVKDLQSSEILIAHCSPDAAAWKCAERIAHNVKKNHIREDGMQYEINSVARTMTVTIKLVPR